MPGEWLTVAESRAGQRMLYVHGGGYVGGSPASHRRLCENLARATECEILNLDYRMGPEHPYPAAVDDAISGLQFVQANGPAGPSGAEIVFVGGDSAGGGLTLATLLAARERGLEMPAGGVCLSPWTDLVRTIAGNDPPQPEDVMARAMAEAYVGDADAADPLISPAFADYAGIPPLLLQVGEPEPLVPDMEIVADRARGRGGRHDIRNLAGDAARVARLRADPARGPGGDRPDRRVGARARAHGCRGRLSRSAMASSERHGPERVALLAQVDDLDAAPVPLEVFGGEASMALSRARVRCRAAPSLRSARGPANRRRLRRVRRRWLQERQLAFRSRIRLAGVP